MHHLERAQCAGLYRASQYGHNVGPVCLAARVAFLVKAHHLDDAMDHATLLTRLPGAASGRPRAAVAPCRRHLPPAVQPGRGPPGFLPASLAALAFVSRAWFRAVPRPTPVPAWTGPGRPTSLPSRSRLWAPGHLLDTLRINTRPAPSISAHLPATPPRPPPSPPSVYPPDKPRSDRMVPARRVRRRVVGHRFTRVAASAGPRRCIALPPFILTAIAFRR